MDIDFLQRRIELLHNDNQSNREDIARMTNQLIFKVSNREDIACMTNQLIFKVRLSLDDFICWATPLIPLSLVTGIHFCFYVINCDFCLWSLT